MTDRDHRMLAHMNLESETLCPICGNKDGLHNIEAHNLPVTFHHAEDQPDYPFTREGAGGGPPIVGPTLSSVLKLLAFWLYGLVAVTVIAFAIPWWVKLVIAGFELYLKYYMGVITP